MSERIALLAYSEQDARQWRRQNEGLSEAEAIYIANADKLLGVTFDRYETTDLFWERKDAAALFDLAKTRITP